MNSLKKTTICLLFLCIGVNCVFSEVPEQINFSYISINEGLSQSTVFSIDQDQRGNMWFATYDGVNKYDGYSFTVYQHNEEDPNSIANDISRIVKTDSQGRVWIGTRDGLSYYDEEKDKFRNFFYEKKGKRQQINGIAEISPEQLLISTQEGLTMFDIKESKFVDDSFSTAMHKLIASALYRQGDIIYIGTPVDGLYSYSIPQKKLEKITPITETKQIQAILQQSPTRIWVATEGAGLLLLNPKTKEVKAYHHSSSNPKSISSNYIRSLALDSQNRLWIGTFNDLNIYHEGSDSFVSYSSSPVENGSLSQRSVRSIFMDSQGGMWLGTYFGGLNYYHPIRNRFKNIQRIPYKNSLSDNVVSCITEDKDKNLWIGTNDGGLNLYNTKTQQFTHYILQEDEDGWVFVESGRVRGFIRKDELNTGEKADLIIEEAKELSGEENPVFEKATKLMNPLKNKNLLYTKTTAGKTVVDKEYAFCNTDKINIREGKSTDARVIGTLSQNQVCYVLASKNQEWVYVESGDVRGFAKSEYLLMGEEAEEKAKAYTDAGQDPETVCGLADQMIAPEDNAVCYYTFKSVKEASVENPTRQALINYCSLSVTHMYGEEQIRFTEQTVPVSHSMYMHSSVSVFQEHPQHSRSME